jgi:DNA-binding XRE family transcriptional regulator
LGAFIKTDPVPTIDLLYGISINIYYGKHLPPHVQSQIKMRKVAKIPRILKINRVEGLTISVVFNNGESRVLDFAEILKSIDIPRESNGRILSDPKELKKVTLNNYTLSWKKAGQTIGFREKEKIVPFEIGADILYRLSKKDQQAHALAIGSRLRQIREKAGLTQTGLAQKSGTSRNYISRIENDKSGIELSTLQKIVETGLGKRLEITIR